MRWRHRIIEWGSALILICIVAIVLGVVAAYIVGSLNGTEFR